MALTIQNHNIQSQLTPLQHITDTYKKSDSNKEKIEVKNQPKVEEELTTNIINTDLKQYLSKDELRVLKEVFGDETVVANTPYNNEGAKKLLIGSRIDIRL